MSAKIAGLVPPPSHPPPQHAFHTDFHDAQKLRVWMQPVAVASAAQYYCGPVCGVLHATGVCNSAKRVLVVHAWVSSATEVTALSGRPKVHAAHVMYRPPSSLQLTCSTSTSCACRMKPSRLLIFCILPFKPLPLMCLPVLCDCAQTEGLVMRASLPSLYCYVFKLHITQLLLWGMLWGM